jgi:ABC-type branched-subunit amino acid transport system substrate-binding protein
MSKRWYLSVVGVIVASVTIVAPVAASAASDSSEKPTATEIGVTATEIRIAIIADVDNPIVPGVFQGSVDGVRGAAKYLNSKAGGGGVAGRKLVVDFIDSKLNPNAARNATITACGQDLAMIGTSTSALTSVDDMVSCPDQAGVATGLPDIPAVNGAVEGCAPLAYPINPNPAICSTVGESPQTYQTNQGAFTYLAKQHKGLHGAYVYSNDSKAGAATGQVLIHASTGAGIAADSTTGLSALAPQSAFTPVIQSMKSANANYAYAIGTVSGMISLRSEAQIQGVSDPKIVWVCTAACYDKTMHDQAEVMDKTYVPLQFLPFEEAKSNATLGNFVKYVGADKVNAFAAYGWVATLAFADAMKAAVAKHGVNGVTRASLLEGIKTLTKFDAGGMLGTVDIANHTLSSCTLLTQFTNDKFVRVWPRKKGTFDCSPKNYVKFQADYLGG